MVHWSLVHVRGLLAQEQQHETYHFFSRRIYHPYRCHHRWYGFRFHRGLEMSYIIQARHHNMKNTDPSLVVFGYSFPATRHFLAMDLLQDGRFPTESFSTVGGLVALDGYLKEIFDSEDQEFEPDWTLEFYSESLDTHLWVTMK